MNLWFRLLRVLVQGLLRARVPWDARTRLDFRVWPLDLDLNLHMTNARYMALMDLGRMNLILQTGLGRLVVKERWGPVIASALVRFRRPLHLLEAFSLSTRIIAFERKRNRPEEKDRYGATIGSDIAIWPPRVAGQVTIWNADILPGRDDPAATGPSAGTARQTGA